MTRGNARANETHDRLRAEFRSCTEGFVGFTQTCGSSSRGAACLERHDVAQSDGRLRGNDRRLIHAATGHSLPGGTWRYGHAERLMAMRTSPPLKTGALRNAARPVRDSG